MKKILFLLFITHWAWGQVAPQPKSYIAYRNQEPITIDGKDTEKVWKLAQFTDEFIDIEGNKTPKYKTQVKMLYDDTHFYFFAKMEDPHLWATLKERDTVIFHNNDFEIFLDPDNDSHNYYEFEINALNTVWDLFLTKPYRENNKVLDGWDINGLRSAIHTEGTLNNPNDTDHYWSVEVAIPWAAMREAHMQNNLPTGKFWRVNFSRVHWDFDLKNGKYYRKKDRNGKLLPEYNWVWSPQWKISMHEPELWGYVFFSEKQVGTEDHFEIPKDEALKRYLYSLYHTKKAKNNANFQKALKQGIIVWNEKIRPKFSQTPTRWEVSIKSPFSHQLLVITEEGKLNTFTTDKK
ncbi:carbohydrate-binding family 9-like protein [Capnocytophaga canimorsus]|uniref:carbohydrate-binding family 9-like protein n=1 Tax=Capnocytophaga canimorsus TaxID=28188 RepID=UPI001561FCA3|nr:carbohydrate-binding family 9-like protein [Capnocytophaga canimorsus]